MIVLLNTHTGTTSRLNSPPSWICAWWPAVCHVLAGCSRTACTPPPTSHAGSSQRCAHPSCVRLTWLGRATSHALCNDPSLGQHCASVSNAGTMLSHCWVNVWFISRSLGLGRRPNYRDYLLILSSLSPDDDNIDEADKGALIKHFLKRPIINPLRPADALTQHYWFDFIVQFFPSPHKLSDIHILWSRMK